MKEEFINHLIKRNPELWRLGVGDYIHINYEQEFVTFYLYVFSGKLKGFQRYNWRENKEKRNNPNEGRYYIYKEHPTACFGLHTYDIKKPLILVEGVWEALSFHRINLPCIAVLGNSTKPFLNWITTLPVLTIAAVQPDKASQELRWGVDSIMELSKDADEYTKEDLKKEAHSHLMGVGCFKNA